MPNGSRRGATGEGGYIMVVLLVGIAVSAVWMGAALPSWRQQVMRQREADLIFRGEQYARAIYLYRQRMGNALPPNIDVLVSQRYLRRKYKDPITGKDFLPIGGAGTAAGVGNVGVSGVRSTSNETSLIVYKNQQTYSQFPFDWAGEAQKAGAGVAIVPATGAQGAGGRQGSGGIGAGRQGAPAPSAGRGPAAGRGTAGSGAGAGGRGPAAPPIGGGRGF